MRSRRVARFDGRRLPLAPLIILLPALILGILTMHIWIGGHGTNAAASPAGHSTTIESTAEHQLPPSDAVAEPSPDSGAQCGHGCGSMDAAMATCMLAVVLLTLTLLVPPIAVPLRRHLTVWRDQPVLAWTSVPARTPSPVQLSISRT